MLVGKVKRAERSPQDHQADDEAEVADAIDDERLVRRRAGGMPFDVETDQQIRADTDQFPEDKHLENVAGDHQPQHREAEQRHVREELVEPPRPMKVSAVVRVNLMIDVVVDQFFLHVAGREDVNAGRDQRDHHEHRQRQAVDVVVQRNVEIAELSHRVKRPGEDGLRGRFVLDNFVLFALVIVMSRSRVAVMPRIRVLDVAMFRRLEDSPTSSLAPLVEGDRTTDEAGTNAEDREISSRLALAVRPLEREHLDRKAEQRQQPSRGQEPFQCRAE